MGMPSSKHLSVLATQAARENRSELAGRPALHNVKAGDFTQRIGDPTICFSSKSWEVMTLMLAGD